MTTSETGQVLAAAASEVLETMFFTEVENGAGPPPDAITARLEFRGSPPGVFTLAVERQAARVFASSFLAMEPGEITGEHAGQVICEMANMICGSVLSRIEPDAAFDLLQPGIVPAGVAPGVGRVLASAEGAIALWLDLNLE